MAKISRTAFLSFRSDNPKSAIQKPKWTAFLATLVLLAGFVGVVEAQQQSKIPRIGFLIAPSRAFFSARLEAFRDDLRNLGYIEGKNIVIEYRYAEGKLDHLPKLAAELIGSKVDVMVTSGPASRVATNATKTIPIVFVGVQDPVEAGLVASLARPGGNVTGFSIFAPELGGKRLEILKEVVPKLTRVAFLRGWGLQGGPGGSAKETQAAAQGMGLQLQIFQVKDSNDFDPAFETIIKNRAEALLMNPGAVINTYQVRIVDFAAKNRLPAMYSALEIVDAGGLMSYAPNPTDQYRRAAVYVDKILKGTKPAELPVEQPKKFEFIINLKAAKQIGLTIPPNVLARADRVIR